MTTITIRVSAEEKADLETAARGNGQTLSKYIRETLAIRAHDLTARTDDLAARVQRLEEMAGIR